MHNPYCTALQVTREFIYFINISNGTELYSLRNTLTLLPGGLETFWEGRGNEVPRTDQSIPTISWEPARPFPGARFSLLPSGPFILLQPVPFSPRIIYFKQNLLQSSHLRRPDKWERVISVLNFNPLPERKHLSAKCSAE